MCPLVLPALPAPPGALRASNACIMELAKRVASSLLPKFSPHTCLGSRHWWKFAVAWLYFIPLTMGQLITTWHEQDAQEKTVLRTFETGALVRCNGQCKWQKWHVTWFRFMIICEFIFAWITLDWEVYVICGWGYNSLHIYNESVWSEQNTMKMKCIHTGEIVTWWR